MSANSRIRGWLIAAAIFLFGFTVGCAALGWIGLRVFRHAMQAPASAPGVVDRAAVRIGADLSSSLRLTPDQSVRVQAILDHSAINLKNLRARAATEALAELRESTEKIATELPPEKRAEFYRFIARRYERLGLTPPTPESPSP